MLWREEYVTALLQPSVVPKLPFETRSAMVATKRESGFRQVEVWRRLFDAELPIPYWIGATPAAFADLMAITAPSQRWRLVQLSEAWDTLVATDTFALIGAGERAEIIMGGLPTEDAWERFLKEAYGASSPEP